MNKKVTRNDEERVTPVPSSQYPSELVDLPSKGRFYPESHPLAAGQATVRYMTAKDEDILSSQNLMDKGVVLDKLFESVLIGVPPTDVLLGDKTAIIVASRIMAFGPEYKVEVTCPECGAKKNIAIDLSTISFKEVVYPVKNGNLFTMEFPKSKKTIQFKKYLNRIVI